MSSAPQLKIVKESESQFLKNGNQHSSTFFLSVCLPVFRLGFCALRLILLLLLFLPGRYRSCRRSGKFFSLPGKRERVDDEIRQFCIYKATLAPMIEIEG